MIVPFVDTMREFIACTSPEGSPLMLTGNEFLDDGLGGGLYQDEMLLVSIPEPLRRHILADLFLKVSVPCFAVWLSGTDWREAASRLLMQNEESTVVEKLKNKMIGRVSTTELIPLLDAQAEEFKLIFIDGLCDTAETGFMLTALRKIKPSTAFVLGCQPILSTRHSGLPSSQFNYKVADKALTLSFLSDYERPYAEACSWRTGRQSGAYIQVQPELVW